MKKPTDTYQPSLGSHQTLTPRDLQDYSLNPTHFDDLIRNRGLLFTHTHALPCPCVDDINASVHSTECSHNACDNGFLQVLPKQVWGYFNNDQLNKLFEVQGEYNSNMAIITFSAHYVDGSEADFSTFDRVEMEAEYSKRMYERFESSPSGLDRLRYRATEVEYLISHSGKVYEQNVHFILDNGWIKWVGVDRPQYNQALGRGETCSVSYTTKAMYYVNHVMKEIRGSQQFDTGTGQKIAVRLPQHVLVTRQFLYEDSRDEEGNKSSKFPRKSLRVPG